MSKEISQIQQEVEHVRDQLTETLQEIAVRTNPKTITNNIVTTIKAFVFKPQVIGTIGTITTVFVGLIITGKIKKYKDKKRTLAAVTAVETLEQLAAELL